MGQGSGQYIPLAATWLNGRRWEDEPAPAQFTVTQGEFINRLNVLQLSLTSERRIRVGGRVLALGAGEIRLP